jgi:hypothetical protein
MVTRLWFVAISALTVSTGPAAANDDPRSQRRFSAELRATAEVPVVSSPARGRFKAVIDVAAQTITFELSYRDLEAEPVQAHIHVGQRDVNGGVSVFLCGPAPHQACPPAPAKVTGIITPADVVGPVAQGIDPATDADSGFAELVQLLRRELTYANVHSTKFPTGEIRGQIKAERR